MAGLEALARWRTAEGVLIPPTKFIPIAEASGDILMLGNWVLEAACRQAVLGQFQRVWRILRCAGFLASSLAE